MVLALCTIIVYPNLRSPDERSHLSRNLLSMDVASCGVLDEIENSDQQLYLRGYKGGPALVVPGYLLGQILDCLNPNLTVTHIRPSLLHHHHHEECVRLRPPLSLKSEQSMP